MKEIPTKKEILARRKEIEEEFSELLKEYDSPFTLEYIKDIIYQEDDIDDMMKIVAIFDTGQGAAELDNIIELASDAWNYFPHQILGGLSPMEIILKPQENK
jgi:hypothetical protein